jgi:hypothetical protein
VKVTKENFKELAIADMLIEEIGKAVAKEALTGKFNFTAQEKGDLKYQAVAMSREADLRATEAVCNISGIIEDEARLPENDRVLKTEYDADCMALAYMFSLSAGFSEKALAILSNKAEDAAEWNVYIQAIADKVKLSDLEEDELLAVKETLQNYNAAPLTMQVVQRLVV